MSIIERRGDRRDLRVDRRKADQKISSDTGAVGTGIIAFALVAYLTLDEPSLKFGEAIGPKNLAIVLAIVLFSVVAACVSLQFLIGRKRWNWKVASVFAVVAISISGGVSDSLIKLADDRFDFGVAVMQSKVHYYCKQKFRPSMCSDQLTLCPGCKTIFNKEERKDLQTKLIAFADKLDNDVRLNEKAQASGPLSEATEQWRKRNGKRAPAAAEASH